MFAFFDVVRWCACFKISEKTSSSKEFFMAVLGLDSSKRARVSRRSNSMKLKRLSTVNCNDMAALGLLQLILVI